MFILLFASIVCAQKSDPNKFAVIINGAGGEAVYAKQFEEWTRQLSSVLAAKFDNLKDGAPAIVKGLPAAVPASAPMPTPTSATTQAAG